LSQSARVNGWAEVMAPVISGLASEASRPLGPCQSQTFPISSHVSPASSQTALVNGWLEGAAPLVLGVASKASWSLGRCQSQTFPVASHARSAFSQAALVRGWLEGMPPLISGIDFEASCSLGRCQSQTFPISSHARPAISQAARVNGWLFSVVTPIVVACAVGCHETNAAASAAAPNNAFMISPHQSGYEQEAETECSLVSAWPVLSTGA
jgi:chromate transport protein ChrA